MADAINWIRKLLKDFGEEEFLAWAKENHIRPTYNDALYWLVEVKGMTGNIEI